MSFTYADNQVVRVQQCLTLEVCPLGSSIPSWPSIPLPYDPGVQWLHDLQDGWGTKGSEGEMDILPLKNLGPR